MVTTDGKTIIEMKIYIKRYYSRSRNKETYANYLETKYVLGLESRLLLYYSVSMNEQTYASQSRKKP